MPKKLCAMILLCAGLAACATPAPLRIVTDTSCTSFRPISYAQLPKGQADDPGNKADSDETVSQIDIHNARWDALCMKGK
jgi:hypothetical protein